MSVLARTKVGGGYRTTVPREVRKFLGISEGSELEWVYESGRIVVRR